MHPTSYRSPKSPRYPKRGNVALCLGALLLCSGLFASTSGLFYSLGTGIPSTKDERLVMPAKRVLKVAEEAIVKEPIVKGSIAQEPTEEEPVHLVYASDGQALPGIEASIRSAMHHAVAPLAFHYIGDTPLPSFPDVEFINLTQVTEKYKLKEYRNYRKNGEGHKGLNRNLANYARFHIHDLLPDVTKAMWVDADTIFQCDVTRMVRSALTNTSHVIAAVPVPGKPHSVFSNADKILKERNITTSFNAGVYVVDLERWRAQNTSEQIREMAIRNRKERLYRYGSQPPLALVIGKDFEHLELRWNSKAKWLNEDKKWRLPEACLVHWNGASKPWKGNDPLRDVWEPYGTKTSTTK